MVKIKNIINFLEKKNLKIQFTGQKDDMIEGFSSLYNYKPQTITWCKNANIMENDAKERYKLLLAPEYREDLCDNCIVTDSPKSVFFFIIEEFFFTESKLPDRGAGTYISEDVEIGKNVKIGHNCVISGKIKIGDNTIIYNNVNIISSVNIGCNCTIQSGAIIGHDDYSYVEDENHKKKMIKHYGGVEIEDDVLIGPACVINRGTIDNSVIKEGCKIDAQCLISHNAYLGKNSSLVCGAKIYGSVKTGDNLYIASAMIKNQVEVGENVVVGMGSVVLKNIEDNTTVIGVPARPLKK